MTNPAAPNARLALRPLILSAALAGSFALGACSSPASTPATSAPGPTAAAKPTAAPAASPATASSPAPAGGPAASASPAASPAAATAPVQKVNANTATQDQIAQALTAAGVPNGARWAREVVEYRPYPTDDPNFGKLRGELAKYNPGPGVVDQIISALSL